MSLAKSQCSAGKLPAGLAIVAILHLLLLYGLVSSPVEEVANHAQVAATDLLEILPLQQLPPRPAQELPSPLESLPPQGIYLPTVEAPMQSVEVLPGGQQQQITTSVMPPPVPEAHLQTLSSPMPTTITPRPAQINANDPACRPTFPPSALDANDRGITRLRFTVDAQGKVTNAEVIGSSGSSREHRLLDDAAAAALSTCQFTPGIDESGKFVSTIVAVDWDWRIDH